LSTYPSEITFKSPIPPFLRGGEGRFSSFRGDIPVIKDFRKIVDTKAILLIKGGEDFYEKIFIDFSA